MPRTILLVPSLLTMIGLAAPAARPADQAELAGIYSCDGANPDGTPYRGIVEIARNEGTFRVRWVFPNRRPTIGIGIVSGDMLSVSYFGSGTAGLAVYKIEEGKPLVGQWTVAGADGTVYKETLTRLPAGARDPSVSDPHTAPDGGERRRIPIRPIGPVIQS